MFLQAPGLAVAMPSSPGEAKGLLLAALAHNGPVLILEHRWLYNRIGLVPEEMYLSPLGRGRVICAGQDITICALSLMVEESLTAAEILKKEGISAEVIDMRWVNPIDEELLLESVCRTGHLVVADTGHIVGGWSAEIAALAADKAWNFLKAPIRRIGLPAAPTPAAANLEKNYYPNWEKIVTTVKEILYLCH
jgi:pyruvate dehydrogenase E1 component beta subunit